MDRYRAFPNVNLSFQQMTSEGGWRLVDPAVAPDPGCGPATGIKAADNRPEIHGFHCPLCCLLLTHVPSASPGRVCGR